MMTVEELKASLKKLDLALNPYDILMNPKDYEKLKNCLDMFDKKRIFTYSYIDEGKVYILDRSEFEPKAIYREYECQWIK